jgi:hypothetical protein
LQKEESGSPSLNPTALGLTLLIVKCLSYCKDLSYLCTYDFTAPYVMFLMRADTLRGGVGERWVLEIGAFMGPVQVCNGIEPLGACHWGRKKCA